LNPKKRSIPKFAGLSSKCAGSSSNIHAQRSNSRGFSFNFLAIFTSKAFCHLINYAVQTCALITGLSYIRTGDGNDALPYIDRQGNSITQSQLAILRLAACTPDTPAIPRHPNHHDLVAEGAKFIAVEENTVGGQLGNPKGARFRVYDRLKRHIEHEKAHRPLFVSAELEKAIDEIYRYPLRQSAIDKLNSRFREKINDTDLAELVLAMRTDDCLCVISEELEEREAQIIC